MSAETFVDFPDLTREMLVELGGSLELRAARQLYKEGAVHKLDWDPPLLSGTVLDTGETREPRLNLRSLVFTENRCSCDHGRRGLVCRHALALCLQAEAQQLQAVEEHMDTPEPADPVMHAERDRSSPELASIALNPSGPLLHLWILLPPNLEKMAAQGFIPLKIELEADGWRGPVEKLPENAYAVTPVLRGVLAELESMGGGRLASLFRLAPELLSAMLQVLGEETRLAWIQKPGQRLVAEAGKFPGVSEHLVSKNKKDRVVPSPSVPSKKTDRIQARKPGKPSSPAPAKQRLRVEVDGSEHFLSFYFSDSRHPVSLGWIDILRQHQFKCEPSNEKYWLRDRHHTLNFLARYWPALKADSAVRFSRNFKQRTSHLRMVHFQVKAGDSADGMTFSMELDAGKASPGDIQRALLSNQHYLQAGRGVQLLPPDLLERTAELQRNLTGQRERVLATRFKTRVSPAALPMATELLEDYDPDCTLPETWMARGSALRQTGNLKAAPIDPAFETQLRSYQRLGTAWLWHLYQNELGGILADEMGLGKTLQALGLIQSTIRTGLIEDEPERAAKNRGPALVVCPASLVENWRREAARFTPELRVFPHHGQQRLQDPEDARDIDLIITSYGTLVRDQPLFQSMQLSLVLADEAQHVKNRRTQASRALRALQSRGRFILTGTPIENAADDLRGLFAFLMPGYLKPLPTGLKAEDRLWYDQHHLLQAAPYVLRRTKKMVAPELPEKIEQTLFCEMTSTQRTFYEGIRRRTEEKIIEMEKAGAGENRIKFAALTQLLRLRQVCADPRVLDPKFKADHSTKLLALKEILNEAMDDGHRILLFSQFTGVLKQLRETLEEESIPLCYLDGSTTNRQDICDQFNNDASIPIFLISLKAGGVGLNLTGADTVIHYDPWWNPAAEAQATDRAHRIGQDRVVTSIKFIAADTVEEKVLEIQAAKARLLRELFEASDAASAKVSLADIKALIAKPKE